MRTLRWGGPLALAVSLVVLAAGAVRADDKPEPKALTPEQKALDATLRKSLFEVIDYAARLHNAGQVEDGYRVFQGGLIAIRPMLSHHPEMQTYISDGLRSADRMDNIEKASFKLRAVLDNLREGLKTGELPAESKPLWIRLGGDKGVGKIVDDFIDAAADDPKVNFTRNGKYQIDRIKLSEALVAQISSLTGGPLKYTKDMKAVHKDMNITEAEYTAAVGHLKKALEKNKVAADDALEILAAVEDMRRDIVAPKAVKAKTLWEELGGEPGVTKLVDDFVALASKDPLVNFDRKKKYTLDAETLGKVKKELVKQVSYLTGGPDQPEKDAPPVWKDLGITDAEFGAAALHLSKALKDNRVPPQTSKAFQEKIINLRDKIVVVEPFPIDPLKTTRWDRFGGEKGVAKIVEDFYTGASKNDKVNLSRGGTVKLEGAVAEGLKKVFAAQVTAAAGGMLTADMAVLSKSLKVSETEFDALKDELKKALEKNGGKADDVQAALEAFEKLRKDVIESKKPDEAGAEVTGTVTVDGKPLAAGKISFYGSDAKPVEGEIKDGMYKLSGLKAGAYRIGIKAGDEIGAQYGLKETTPLQYEIVKDKEKFDIPLKGKK